MRHVERDNAFTVVGLGFEGTEARLKSGPSDDVILHSQA